MIGRLSCAMAGSRRLGEIEWEANLVGKLGGLSGNCCAPFAAALLNSSDRYVRRDSGRQCHGRKPRKERAERNQKTGGETGLTKRYELIPEKHLTNRNWTRMITLRTFRDWERLAGRREIALVNLF